MADNNYDNNNHVNGVNGSDPTTELFESPINTPKKSSDPTIDLLNQKVTDLTHQNSSSESRIKELQAELESVRLELASETERADSEKKAAEAIAKHTSGLEGEVARLQHDLINACNETSDANEEVRSLKSKVDALTKEKSELGEKVKELEAHVEEMMEKGAQNEEFIAGLVKKVHEREEELARAVEGVEKGRDGEKEKGVLVGFKERAGNVGYVGVGVAAAVVLGGIVCHVRFSRN